MTALAVIHRASPLVLIGDKCDRVIVIIRGSIEFERPRRKISSLLHYSFFSTREGVKNYYFFNSKTTRYRGILIKKEAVLVEHALVTRPPRLFSSFEASPEKLAVELPLQARYFAQKQKSSHS